MTEPVLVVDQLRRGFTFDAYHAAVGMIMIRIESNHAAILDRRDRRAVCRAQGAITANRAR